MKDAGSASAAAGPAVPGAALPGARIIPFPEGGSAEAAAPRDTMIPPEDSIRWARVRTARERMAADFYDRPVVRERIAAALLQDLLSP